MRISILAVLLLAACAPDSPQQPAERQLFAGQGRDRLCQAGDRAGFVAYGQGDSNCSVRGRLQREGKNGAILPDGDEDCRIPVTLEGETAVLGAAPAACSYYCGPGATFAGKTFTSNASASPAIDFAGDPLC